MPAGGGGDVGGEADTGGDAPAGWSRCFPHDSSISQLLDV
jgi:hypothetical protein